MRAVARHDNELPNRLPWVVVFAAAARRTGCHVNEARARNRASAVHVALPQAGHVEELINFKALVAIETQGELSQREMGTWRRLVHPADHRFVIP